MATAQDFGSRVRSDGVLVHAMEAPDADMRETVPASEDEGLQRSPSPKRKLNPAEEAAAQDLVVRDPEGPPAWVESFQLAISAQVSTLGGHLKSFEQRLEMESKSRKEDISDVHKRLDDLAGKLEALSKGSGGTADFRAVPPPDPWMQYRERKGSSNPTGSLRAEDTSSRPSSPNSGQGANGPDYNHLVLGGWLEDTPRREIERAVADAVAQWDPAVKGAVEKTIVYGQRATCVQVWLKPLPSDEARARFFQIVKDYGSSIPTGTGNSWISPNKSADHRRRNRATRSAKEIVEGITGLAVNQEDLDWSKQLIWIGRTRVVATSGEPLKASTEHKVARKTIRDAYGEETTFHFNISVLAVQSSKTEGEVEQAIHSN